MSNRMVAVAALLVGGCGAEMVDSTEVAEGNVMVACELVATSNLGRQGRNATTQETAATGNGISLNGISLNGISMNGVSVNGVSLNGLKLGNGISVNGKTLNGLSAANRLAVNGLNATNRLAVNGLNATNRLAVNGLNATNRLAVNGLNSANGISLNGARAATGNGISLNGRAETGIRLQNGLDIAAVGPDLHLDGLVVDSAELLIDGVEEVEGGVLYYVSILNADGQAVPLCGGGAASVTPAE